jgi:hypothetical protein
LLKQYRSQFAESLKYANGVRIEEAEQDFVSVRGTNIAGHDFEWPEPQEHQTLYGPARDRARVAQKSGDWGLKTETFKQLKNDSSHAHYCYESPYGSPYGAFAGTTKSGGNAYFYSGGRYRD